MGRGASEGRGEIVICWPDDSNDLIRLCSGVSGLPFEDAVWCTIDISRSFEALDGKSAA